MNNKERLKQLRLAVDPTYSKELKICKWHLDDDFGLTPYGRYRANFCESGYDGCSGKTEMIDVTDGNTTYRAPWCKSCQKHKEKRNV